MGSKSFGGLVVVCVAVTIAAATREASAQKQPATAVHLSASELDWRPLTPEIPLQSVQLWGERSQPGERGYGMFLILPAGAEAGLHAHTRATTTGSISKAPGSAPLRTTLSGRSCLRARTCFSQEDSSTTIAARARKTACSSSTSTACATCWCRPQHAERKPRAVRACDPAARSE